MERIRKLRKEVGVSQKELALEIGLVHQYYSSIETGFVITRQPEHIEQRAIKYLKPKLIDKIISAQAELERLEYLLLQYN